MLLIERVNNKLRSCFYRFVIPVVHPSIKVGKGFSIRKNVSINANDGKILIGDGVFINSNSSINARKSIIIGNNTLIGENVHIYDHNHIYEDIGIAISQQGFKVKEVAIGNNCWISSNVTILMGVNIGDNCIIGANCLVYKDVPNNSIMMLKQECILRERK